ncbi:MAG: glutathione S-transferase family protein, partial [Myxococcota bacterium]
RKNGTPRGIGHAQQEPNLLCVGQRVAVHPTDYLPTPTVGELVAVTEERFTVARKTPDLGRIHVHFPREGFTVSQDKA